MSSKTLYYLYLVIIFVGLVDAMYLSISVLLDVAPVCGPLHGCETIAQSAYAKVHGVPLAYIGVVYYALGALLSSLITSDSKGRLIPLLYAFAGSLASLAFMYIQVALIHAVCIYCLLSAAATFALLAVTVTFFYNSKN